MLAGALIDPVLSEDPTEKNKDRVYIGEHLETESYQFLEGALSYGVKTMLGSKLAENQEQLKRAYTASVKAQKTASYEIGAAQEELTRAQQAKERNPKTIREAENSLKSLTEFHTKKVTEAQAAATELEKARKWLELGDNSERVIFERVEGVVFKILRNLIEAAEKDAYGKKPTLTDVLAFLQKRLTEKITPEVQAELQRLDLIADRQIAEARSALADEQMLVIPSTVKKAKKTLQELQEGSAKEIEAAKSRLANAQESKKPERIAKAKQELAEIQENFEKEIAGAQVALAQAENRSGIQSAQARLDLVIRRNSEDKAKLLKSAFKDLIEMIMPGGSFEKAIQGNGGFLSKMAAKGANWWFGITQKIDNELPVLLYTMLVAPEGYKSMEKQTEGTPLAKSADILTKRVVQIIQGTFKEDDATVAAIAAKSQEILPVPYAKSNTKTLIFSVMRNPEQLGGIWGLVSKRIYQILLKTGLGMNANGEATLQPILEKTGKILADFFKKNDVLLKAYYGNKGKSEAEVKDRAATKERLEAGFKTLVDQLMTETGLPEILKSDPLLGYFYEPILKMLPANLMDLFEILIGTGAPLEHLERWFAPQQSTEKLSRKLNALPLGRVLSVAAEKLAPWIVKNLVIESFKDPKDGPKTGTKTVEALVFQILTQTLALLDPITWEGLSPKLRSATVYTLLNAKKPEDLQAVFTQELKKANLHLTDGERKLLLAQLPKWYALRPPTDQVQALLLTKLQSSDASDQWIRDLVQSHVHNALLYVFTDLAKQGLEKALTRGDQALSRFFTDDKHAKIGEKLKAYEALKRNPAASGVDIDKAWDEVLIEFYPIAHNIIPLLGLDKYPLFAFLEISPPKKQKTTDDIQIGTKSKAKKERVLDIHGVDRPKQAEAAPTLLEVMIAQGLANTYPELRKAPSVQKEISDSLHAQLVSTVRTPTAEETLLIKARFGELVKAGMSHKEAEDQAAWEIMGTKRSAEKVKEVVAKAVAPMLIQQTRATMQTSRAVTDQAVNYFEMDLKENDVAALNSTLSGLARQNGPVEHLWSYLENLIHAPLLRMTTNMVGAFRSEGDVKSARAQAPGVSRENPTTKLAYKLIVQSMSTIIAELAAHKEAFEKALKNDSADARLQEVTKLFTPVAVKILQPLLANADGSNRVLSEIPFMTPENEADLLQGNGTIPTLVAGELAEFYLRFSAAKMQWEKGGPVGPRLPTGATPREVSAGVAAKQLSAAGRLFATQNLPGTVAESKESLAELLLEAMIPPDSISNETRQELRQLLIGNLDTLSKDVNSPLWKFVGEFANILIYPVWMNLNNRLSQLDVGPEFRKSLTEVIAKKAYEHIARVNEAKKALQIERGTSKISNDDIIKYYYKKELDYLIRHELTRQIEKSKGKAEANTAQITPELIAQKKRSVMDFLRKDPKRIAALKASLKVDQLTPQQLEPTIQEVIAYFQDLENAYLEANGLPKETNPAGYQLHPDLSSNRKELFYKRTSERLMKLANLNKSMIPFGPDLESMSVRVQHMLVDSIVPQLLAAADSSLDMRSILRSTEDNLADSIKAFLKNEHERAQVEAAVPEAPKTPENPNDPLKKHYDALIPQLFKWGFARRILQFVLSSKDVSTSMMNATETWLKGSNYDCLHILETLAQVSSSNLVPGEWVGGVFKEWRYNPATKTISLDEKPGFSKLSELSEAERTAAKKLLEKDTAKRNKAAPKKLVSAIYDELKRRINEDFEATLGKYQKRVTGWLAGIGITGAKHPKLYHALHSFIVFLITLPALIKWDLISAVYWSLHRPVSWYLEKQIASFEHHATIPELEASLMYETIDELLTTIENAKPPAKK